MFEGASRLPCRGYNSQKLKGKDFFKNLKEKKRELSRFSAKYSEICLYWTISFSAILLIFNCKALCFLGQSLGIFFRSKSHSGYRISLIRPKSVKGRLPMTFLQSTLKFKSSLINFKQFWWFIKFFSYKTLPYTKKKHLILFFFLIKEKFLTKFMFFNISCSEIWKTTEKLLI